MIAESCYRVSSIDMTEHLNYAHFPDITPRWAFMRGGTVPLLLNMVYPMDVLVPSIDLLVHLFHVFLTVRFSESDPNVV